METAVVFGQESAPVLKRPVRRWAARCFPDSVVGPFQAAIGDSRCDLRIVLGVLYPSPEWSLR